MKTLAKKIWMAALLVAILVAQNTTNTAEVQANEVDPYALSAELDSLLEELSYIPVIPKGLETREAADELSCYFMERDTDAKYIEITGAFEHKMLRIAVHYEEPSIVELYGVSSINTYTLLATYQTNARSTFMFPSAHADCFKGYEVVLRSKKLYRDMTDYISCIGCN